jgi:hypothetical protein
VKVIDEKNMQIERLYRNFFPLPISLLTYIGVFCTSRFLSLEGFSNSTRQLPQQHKKTNRKLKKMKENRTTFYDAFYFSLPDDVDDDDGDTSLFSCVYQCFHSGN